MQENYLAKWLNNELSEEELSSFKKSDEYASYKRISEASQQIKAPKFDVDQAYLTFKNKQMEATAKVVPLNPFKQFLRIAAVIAVMLVGSYFYLNSLDESFNTGLAERNEVLLPDNSQIIMNSDSKVSYSEKNWDKERAVALEGEAFFKVAKGKKFTVATSSGTIAVLGTQFNVENRDGFFEVTCYEGLVRVTYNGKDKKLPAGSSFVVINNKIQNTQKLQAVEPSWVLNESSFVSIPLEFVFDEFERQFNIKVDLKNVNTNQLFTGSFSNTDLQIALESISTPSQISYKLGEDNVLFYAENTP
ncbi:MULTISPECIES: FecR family protein [Croceitalea]|uniref:FecR family protein n=1 Tax=Croceitalea vernalis TaxID=3075599 RepID=A0ABU3BJL7_9FLAO|nr:MULTISPECIES: FecR family protein [unclassified Croceitalea]MDT0540496.1 FecR family protein [Croceitalea sp. P059]MDT0622352.1 FecR family protein [Croceitalea sp. P007]